MVARSLSQDRKVPPQLPIASWPIAGKKAGPRKKEQGRTPPFSRAFAVPEAMSLYLVLGYGILYCTLGYQAYFVFKRQRAFLVYLGCNLNRPSLTRVPRASKSGPRTWELSRNETKKPGSTDSGPESRVVSHPARGVRIAGRHSVAEA